MCSTSSSFDNSATYFVDFNWQLMYITSAYYQRITFKVFGSYLFTTNQKQQKQSVKRLQPYNNQVRLSIYKLSSVVFTNCQFQLHNPYFGRGHTKWCDSVHSIIILHVNKQEKLNTSRHDNICCIMKLSIRTNIHAPYDAIITYRKLYLKKDHRYDNPEVKHYKSNFTRLANRGK